MLVGVYPATAGTATIDGLSLKDDMSSIYLRMGVCPQVIARPCARASPTPLRSEMLP
jgi:ABC-type multidrug transport system ATPase subunit